MQFVEDQVVVHPHHGPATVSALNTRMLKGEPVQYVRLHIEGVGLEVEVPVTRAVKLGIRTVLDADQVSELFGILGAPSPYEDDKWTRRIKDYQDRLRSGDAFTIAALVRDMLRRRENKGLTRGEQELLQEAFSPLVSELSLAMGKTADEVKAALLEAAMGQLVAA